MKGGILELENGRGTIIDNDGNRYYFKKQDWMESFLPQKGMCVEFEKYDNAAFQIYLESPHNRIILPQGNSSGQSIGKVSPPAIFSKKPEQSQGGKSKSFPSFFSNDIVADDQIGFKEAIKICFHKYMSFSGRASRSEFWYFYLFIMLGYSIGLILVPLFPIFFLVTFFPFLAVIVRRLHDGNHSGWWYFIIFVPFGLLILLILLCQGSDRSNRFGRR